MTAPRRSITIILAWLLIVPMAILVPSAPAEAATPPALDTWSSELDFGERLSAGSDGRGIQNLVVSFSAAQIDCTSIVWKGSPACGGPTPAESATPTPIPSPTPIPTPTPDRVAIQAEALAEAEDLMRGELTSVSWEMSPESDQLQIVNLDSYLAADVDWSVTEATSSTKGPSGWEVEVTVKATPHKSMWTFTELGDTARVDVVECYNSGNLFDENNIVPPACPKVWDHSSDITGDVKVEYALEYNVTWSSTILHAGTSGPWTITSDTIEEVTVSEVQAFGWSPKNNHEDGGGCGGFWGWACKVVKVVAEVGLKVVYALAPWIEPFVDFLKGCGDAVVEQLGGLVDIAKQAYAAVTDPGAFVDEKIGLLKDMFEAATADPEGFVFEVLGGVLDVEYLKTHTLAQYVGKMLCGKAIEYLSGAAGAALARQLEKFLGRRRARNGGSCRTSSFPGDTQVVMADGSHRQIETIRPGDHVLSHNLTTSTWEPKRVLDQWSYLDQGAPATIRLADGDTVTATADHLFWVDNTEAWTELQWLKTGDDVATPAGPVAVDTVTVGPRHDWTVWELTVEDNHNFTVLAGDNAVLVHNTTCDIDSEGTVRVRNDDGSVVTHHGDGTTGFVDKNGNVFDNVAVNADGSVKLDRQGNAIYDTGSGVERSPVLNDNGDGTFTSDGGVHYEADDLYGDRVNHVLQHEDGNLKPYKNNHSTFPEGTDPIQSVDQVFNDPNRIVSPPQENGNISIVGQTADGTTVEIIVAPDPITGVSNVLVTAYPVS